MKRVVAAILASFVALLVVPGLAQSRVSGDSAVGQGTFGQLTPATFDFDAQSGPSGEHANGFFDFDFGLIQIGGDVTCLEVVGNQATIGGDVTSGQFAGQSGVFTVLDNDPTAPDKISAVQTTPGPGPAVCLPINPIDQEVTSGNITVVDGQPTEKKICLKKPDKQHCLTP